MHPTAHICHVHVDKLHIRPGFCILLCHLFDDSLADVDVDQVVITNVIHVCTEAGVATAYHENLVRGFDILVEYGAELWVFSIPVSATENILTLSADNVISALTCH